MPNLAPIPAARRVALSVAGPPADRRGPPLRTKGEEWWVAERVGTVRPEWGHRSSELLTPEAVPENDSVTPPSQALWATEERRHQAATEEEVDSTHLKKRRQMPDPPAGRRVGAAI
ncbi:MAG: hypothetical protein VB853_05495 [Pirellulales bacterium]